MKFKVKTSQIKNATMLCGMTVFLAFGVLVAYNAMDLANRISNKMAMVFLFSLSMFVLNAKKKFSGTNNLFKLYVLVCVATFISALMRADSLMGIASILGSISVFLLHKVFPTYKKNIYQGICWATIVSCIFIFYRYSISSYNSQGVIVAFGGIMLLNLLCIKRKKSFLLFVVCLSSVVILLSITRSRTSMMGFLIVAIVSYCYLFMNKVTAKNLIVLVCGIIILLIIHNYLEAFFIRVFFQKWANSDLTSNRTTIWGMIIQRLSLFGHGLQHLGGGDAHNSYMQMLGVFGLGAFVVFLVFIARIFICIIHSKNKIIFLNFFVGWCAISMFENLELLTSRMLSITTLFLIHLALLIGEEKMPRKGKIKS